MDIKYFYIVLITILIYQFLNLLISLIDDEQVFVVWNTWIFFPFVCLAVWVIKKIKNK